MPFIEEYLFFNEEDLKDIALSKRDIFVRQTLNVFHFGKLYIMPNGNIYSNLNGASMGTIKESPHDIVYREMTEGHYSFASAIKNLAVTAFTNGCVLRPLIMNWLLENRTSVM